MWNNTDYQTGPAVRLNQVTSAHFAEVFGFVRNDSPVVREMTSTFDEIEGTRYFLGDQGRYANFGYAIRPDGELVYVFSEVKGMGNHIMMDAVSKGAVYLDCFDGYLVTLYSRHGFRVVKRVENWTPGEPDVVYMSLPGFEGRHGVAA